MHEHTHTIDVKAAFTVTKEPGSQVKIVGDIPYADLESERGAALKSLGANVSIPGFRPGHVPEAMLIKHVGEMNLLTEMAERAISHIYHHILHDFAIDAVGQPKIEITKIAPGNPLGVSIVVAVIPEITLTDYKTVAKAKNAEKGSVEVTDADLETSINDILRRKLAYERLQKKAAAREAGEAGDNTDLPTPETVETPEDLEKLPLPELNDELAQSLGQPGQFADVADFKTKLREHLTIEKTREVAAAHRAAITDAIIEGTTMELPTVLIEAELAQMFGQMQEDLDRANLKLDDYLKHINKTKEDMEKEWTPAAEKRAKLQLILNEIAKKENILPDMAAVEAQVKGLMEQYKDADERRVRLYVASVLTNEAVMKHLESLT
jgi:trigger factor